MGNWRAHLILRTRHFRRHFLEKRGVSTFRCDCILAGAAVALLLIAPLPALAEEAAPIAAGVTDSAKANSTPAAPADETRITEVLGKVDAADRAIAECMRNLLAENPNRIFASETEHAAVEAFYRARDLAPLWHDKGVENARGKTAAARLRNADADGLNPDDYRTPSFAGLGPDALAQAELRMTQAVLTYTRHVQAGRFPYRMVRKDNIGLPQAAPDPAQVLAKLAEAEDVGKTLDEFSPQHHPYQRLKTALAELRGANKLPATDNGDAQMMKRRKSSTRDSRIDTIIANMERWRWYPRDLGNAHVEVNEPDFTLKVLHEGKQVWASRIVIGKPSMPTPLLSETMKSITINPTWRVPPSIVHNEYLPARAKDPGALTRMGLRLSYVDGEPQITMAPGGNNPLGRIRFNFYNRFLVFQHDTPDQYFFAHKVRAESHGCMRVQDAAKYAEVLSQIAVADQQWTAAKVKNMFGSAEHEIELQSVPIWIHLTYQTAFVDDAGKLQTRRDLYNLDSLTLAALKSARAAPEPLSAQKPEPQVASPAPAIPEHRRRKLTHRSARLAASASIFSSGAAGYVRTRPVRGVLYR
jgi:murein L,D-transpeptidase YcbB/YkuD